MIYLDNAATTHPKPPEVITEISRIMNTIGANAGRSGHDLAQKASEVLLDARLTVAEFFNIKDIERLAFTYNTTYALNMLIKGVARRGDHIIIGNMEHNSVLRCVRKLSDCGLITYSIAPADESGTVTPSAVRALIKQNTRLVCINHVSNVCGTINDIKAISEVAHKANALFMVDSAQSAGVVPVDVIDNGIDLLAFAGHKGLFGPQGTAGLYIAPHYELKTLIEGGTGSLSQSPVQPEFMPDRFESGTLNVAGLGGLKKGVEFVKSVGCDNILNHEKELAKRAIDGLLNIKKVKVYGIRDVVGRTGVVSFKIEGKDCFWVAERLNCDYNIAVRSGLHCSPLAHEALGTLDTGLVRASCGFFNTKEDIDSLLFAVSEIAK